MGPYTGGGAKSRKGKRLLSALCRKTPKFFILSRRKEGIVWTEKRVLFPPPLPCSEGKGGCDSGAFHSSSRPPPHRGCAEKEEGRKTALSRRRPSFSFRGTAKASRRRSPSSLFLLSLSPFPSLPLHESKQPSVRGGEALYFFCPA